MVPGAPARLILSLSNDFRAVGTPIQAVVQVRDKSKRAAFLTEARTIRPAAEIPLPFVVPRDAGYDLFSARVVLVQQLDVTYTRILGAMSGRWQHGS